MDTNEQAVGLSGVTTAATVAGGSGEAADALAARVARFCHEQDALCAWLAQAGARGGDPPEGRKTDGGAHQPPS